ncbi:AmmeMemoRadiSam system radical SAM enzyme [Candidatus Bathyarchaeota archaeon]|nr:MAG: AmmeMemoRadiSam system radical SAM enzyme [Candidatus Bathyarchaeota archaeon]
MRFEEAPSVREALIYEALPDGSVRCGVCERRCRVPEGGRGFCGSRRNSGGRLYTLTYGDLSSISLNPIEKKPLFHYWPGSRALSAGSWGCNLRCIYCQNHPLSMASADPDRARYVSPEGFVGLALDRGGRGLSFTFNEASCTLLEYVVDCFRLAAVRGLYCNLNTNGYMTPEALEALAAAGLDSMCIDVKGDEEFYRRLCNGADVEVVWRNAAEAKRRGLHVEVVNLVIPGANDGDECIEEIITRTRDGLGRDTPLHFTRFYPAYRAEEYGLSRVTPVETLERARLQALEEGLKYVYVGNVPDHEGENTFCPNCGQLLIERRGFAVLGYSVTDDDRCPECGRGIPIVGEPTLFEAR